MHKKKFAIEDLTYPEKRGIMLSVWVRKTDQVHPLTSIVMARKTPALRGFFLHIFFLIKLQDPKLA